jgi:hypothetical protein
MRCLVRGPVSVHYLLAHLSEAWINRWVVLIRDLAVHDAARPILRQKRGVLGVIRQFGFFLSVQVIEVAVELVEAMHGGQELVAVAKVVLAELARGIAERLEAETGSVATSAPAMAPNRSAMMVAMVTNMAVTAIFVASTNQNMSSGDMESVLATRDSLPLPKNQ